MFLFLLSEAGIVNEKKRNFGGAQGHAPWKILKVKTEFCAIWGILEANLHNLKFMMNISFVPSICIHRSIILIFIEKMYGCQFFFYMENSLPPPWFSIFISVRIFVSMTNSRLCIIWYLLPLHSARLELVCLSVRSFSIVAFRCLLWVKLTYALGFCPVTLAIFVPHTQIWLCWYNSLHF